MEESMFGDLEKLANISINPCEESVDLSRMGFKPLNLSKTQKSRMGMLLQQAPTSAMASEASQLYRVSFPDGLPHTLVALKQGGYSSMVRGDKGRFIASASFHPMAAEAALLSSFSVMSIATGQYFLTQIDSEFKMINQKLDDIVSFLYGDKKAELMAEIIFVQNAYRNYSSIMTHDEQRIAILSGLQESVKVAMKDIEFYMNDLDNTIATPVKNYPEFEKVAADAFHSKDSLEMAMQLYVFSNIMGIYYSQNFDDGYLDSLKDGIQGYIEKCERRILTAFGKLAGRSKGFKANPLKKIDPSKLDKKIDEVNNSLNSGNKSHASETLAASIDFLSSCTECYVNNKGETYIKALA